MNLIEMLTEGSAKVTCGGMRLKRLPYEGQAKIEPLRFYQALAEMAHEVDGDLTITGQGVHDCIGDLDSLDSLAHDVKTFADYRVYVHIDADIKAAEKSLPKGQIRLRNLFGDSISTRGWGTGLSTFDKHWNLSLCFASIGDGYEFPRTARDFRYMICSHAGFSMVGTQEQLGRYQKVVQWMCDDAASQLTEYRDPKIAQMYFDSAKQLEERIIKHSGLNTARARV